MNYAVKCCREKNYLNDYLDRKEFLTMAETEFTLKDYMEVIKETSCEKEIQEHIRTCKEFGLSKDEIAKKY